MREFLAGTPYAACEQITVSARDGRGVPELLAALERAAARAEAGRAQGPARLAVDRVFPLKGIGTVVTGTVWRGEIRAGDPLVVAPRGKRVAVRSVQVHDHEAEVVRGGSRAGVNLRGLDRQDVARGDWLVAPELAAHTCRRFDAWVRVLPGARPLKAGLQVRLHHGTAQFLARVAPLQGGELAPGAEGAAVVRLDGDAAVEPHDRFIVRSLSPVATVAGGEVLVTGARHWHDRERHLGFLAAVRGGEVRRAAALLAADHGQAGLTAADLARRGLRERARPRAPSRPRPRPASSRRWASRRRAGSPPACRRRCAPPCLPAPRNAPPHAPNGPSPAPPSWPRSRRRWPWPTWSCCCRAWRRRVSW